MSNLIFDGQGAQHIKRGDSAYDNLHLNCIELGLDKRREDEPGMLGTCERSIRAGRAFLFVGATQTCGVFCF